MKVRVPVKPGRWGAWPVAHYPFEPIDGEFYVPLDDDDLRPAVRNRRGERLLNGREYRYHDAVPIDEELYPTLLHYMYDWMKREES